MNEYLNYVNVSFITRMFKILLIASYPVYIPALDSFLIPILASWDILISVNNSPKQHRPTWISTSIKLVSTFQQLDIPFRSSCHDDQINRKPQSFDKSALVVLLSIAGEHRLTCWYVRRNNIYSFVYCSRLWLKRELHKMLNFELMTEKDRKEAAAIERRRRMEDERKKRIFDPKTRLFGVSENGVYLMNY